jgi:O-antigen/teichoic acid export membrane protein
MPLPPQLRSLAGHFDRGVTYTLLNRFANMACSLLVISLVLTVFSSEVQGYYFTFNSLLLGQVLLELGFGIVLIQFISHEWASLGYDDRGDITGAQHAVARLGSLVRFSLKWYGALALIFLVAVGSFGQWFLRAASSERVAVFLPWWLLCVGVGANLVIFPLRCFLEGSNQVHRSQACTLWANIAGNIAGCPVIVLGGGLFALAAISLVTAAVNALLLTKACLPFFRLMRASGAANGVSWREEFLPQQRRIGVSWSAGYVMYQSAIPIVFRNIGPKAAGKLGATLQIYNGINIIASSFLNAAGPRMGILGAKREYAKLQQLVRRTWLQCLFLSAVLGLGAVAAIAGLKHWGFPQGERFAEWPVTLIYIGVVIAQQLMNAETTAVRFQKLDPFVGNSVLCAALVLLGNVFLGQRFGLIGVAVGFAIVTVVVAMPWCHYVYNGTIACFLKKGCENAASG